MVTFFKQHKVILITFLSSFIAIALLAVTVFVVLEPNPFKGYNTNVTQRFSGELSVTIVGDNVEGEILLATSTGLTPAPQRLTYTWYVDDEIVDSATGTQFPLTEELIGSVITVEVTASSINFISLTAVSEPSGTIIEAPITEAELQQQIVNLLSSYDGNYAVTVEEINGLERKVSIDGNVSLDPASAIKTFYAYYALKKAENGVLNLDSSLPSGLTYRECIKLSLSVSDNDCAIELRLSGPMVSINEMFQREGYSDTYLIIENGEYVSKRTSTDDLALLLRRLEEGTLLDEPYSKILKEALYNQIWLTKIPAGLPSEIVSFNKTGQLFTPEGLIEADTAIVRGSQSTYVITILGYNNAEGEALTEVSKLVYQELQQEDSSGVTYPLEQFLTTSPTLFSPSPGATGITLPVGTSLELYYSQGKLFSVYYRGELGWVDSNKLKTNSAYTKPILAELQ